MYIIILGYLFIPRFIVADDVLCPNKDEQGNKSCGWYKRECERSLLDYQHILKEENDFKNTLLRKAVAYTFGNMKNHIASIESQIEDDQTVRNDSDLTIDEKKDRLRDDRRSRYYSDCRDSFNIRCMKNALVTINSFGSEQEKFKEKIEQNVWRFKDACNSCDDDFQCEQDKFHDIQLDILGVNSSEDEKTTEEESGEEGEEEGEEGASPAENSEDPSGEKEESGSASVGGSETSESSSETPEKPSCEGIKLNTNIPFIGNCIPSTSQAEIFPIFIGGLIKFTMSLLLLIGFICILIGGVMITTEKVTEGKNLIMKVIRALAAIGGSGVILKIINPNFFS